MAVIPDKFLGTFKHEKDENFEAFLEKKDIPWMMKKAMTSVHPTKKIKRDDDNPGGYVIVNEAAIMTQTMKFKLNVPFETEGGPLNKNAKQKATISVIGEDTLLEERENVDDPTKAGCVRWTIEGDHLVGIASEGVRVGFVYTCGCVAVDRLTEMSDNGGVTAKRFFKRVP